MARKRKKTDVNEKKAYLIENAGIEELNMIMYIKGKCPWGRVKGLNSWAVEGI